MEENLRWFWMLFLMMIAGGIVGYPRVGDASDYVIYSVFKGVDLGNPGEAPLKDYYVNMGTAQGVRNGSVLEVLRRTSSYDLMSEKLYKDVTFPIARLKVIHVESNAAIARLEKMLPADQTPAIHPNAVIVGDHVRLAE